MANLMPLNLDSIAEERIQEAVRRGDFDDLPGAGRPIEFDDDLLVPPEARLVSRVLKNAGLVPPEIEERKELAALEAALPSIRDKAQRVLAHAKLALLRTRLGARRSRTLSRNPYYSRKIIEKLAGG